MLLHGGWRGSGHRADPTAPSQVMTDVAGNPEEERRAEFYHQPWSQEAVSRYFYCKVWRGPCTSGLPSLTPGEASLLSHVCGPCHSTNPLAAEEPSLLPEALPGWLGGTVLSLTNNSVTLLLLLFL